MWFRGSGVQIPSATPSEILSKAVSPAETPDRVSAEVIGGDRDLYVNKTSENGWVSLSVDDPLLPNLLIFDAGATGNGERRVTWDGPDDDATKVADTGLGMVDLTSGETDSRVYGPIDATGSILTFNPVWLRIQNRSRKRSRR